jgi:hypothetical protein
MGRESTALLAALRDVPCLYSEVADVRVLLYPSFDLFDQSAWLKYALGVGSFLIDLPPTVDIAAIELPAPPLAPPDDRLSRLVHTVLAALAAMSGNALTLYDRIERADWELSLFGREFFALLLSGGYPRDHPRHLAWRQPVILLQPEESFTRHRISSASVERSYLSIRTERAFRRRGRRYLPVITRAMPKSYRLIKPVDETSAPVTWWTASPLVPIEVFQRHLSPSTRSTR